MDKINLLNYSQQDLNRFFVDLGEKPFRAKQLFKWIHKHGADNFEQMTDLSKPLRETLAAQCEIKAPEIAEEHCSADGTVKWLLRLTDGNFIETVFIPENDRGTLCISSQVGCILNCSFCSTAKQGFSRNLTLSEIIGQLWLAAKRLRELNHSNPALSHSITNVVMMGMGEPLLNFEAVVPALAIMRDELAYALPRRRVTLSTAGMVPQIDQLKNEADVSLAISLHAPNDSLRDQLVPLNKKYPIQELMEVCKRFIADDRRRHITIEYVMLRGINDELKHAKELCKILNGVHCKINLIPFNSHPGALYQRSLETTIQEFRNHLVRSGFVTTIRKTRGQDIDAACGQLAGKVLDRTLRSTRWKNLKQLKGIQIRILEQEEYQEHQGQEEKETWMEKTA